MTKAQDSVASRVMEISRRMFQMVKPDFTLSDRHDLIKRLCSIQKPTSVWGQVIVTTMPNSDNHEQLIIELSSQAVDDPIVMMDIVGIRATILLLRYYSTFNPDKL